MVERCVYPSSSAPQMDPSCQLRAVSYHNQEVGIAAAHPSYPEPLALYALTFYILNLIFGLATVSCLINMDDAGRSQRGAG